MAKLRFAVVASELGAFEHELAIGNALGRFASRVVVGINGKRAVDLDRPIAIDAVEHQPPAKSTHADATLLV